MPLPPDSSSITVVKSRSPRGAPTASSASTARRYAAMPAFMSPAPRPHIRPSVMAHLPTDRGSNARLTRRERRRRGRSDGAIARPARSGSRATPRAFVPRTEGSAGEPARGSSLAALASIWLNALDREAERREALLDDALGALFRTEQALLADEPRGQVVEVLDALVDGLLEGVDQEVRSRAISSKRHKGVAVREGVGDRERPLLFAARAS